MAAGGRGRTGAEPLELQIGRALMGAGAGEGLLACDRVGAIGYCDATAAALLASRRSLAGRRRAEALDPLDEPLSLRFQSALRDPSAMEFVVARPAAEDEWVEVRVLPLESGAAFLLRDVTDRERSERGLRRKERRLRAINESLRLAHRAARAASWEWLAGGIRWLEPGAARALIGLPAKTSEEEEAIADWRSFVTPEDLPAVDAALRALRERDEVSFEYRVAAADGARRWLRSSAAVVERRPDGVPLRVSGVTLDITEQKLGEAKLQREIQERSRAEERQQLLIHELNHRVKNMLATVQSIARQSLGRAETSGELADFENRLMALAWAHDILTRESWAGASLQTVMARTMAPHAATGRVELQGPDLWLPPQTALALAMGVHELATNAVKYGALSTDAGRVSIHWRVERDASPMRLVLTWAEQGGPRVSPPKGRGFGSRLLERGLARELGGRVALSFEPAGVRCRIEAPLSLEPEASGPTARGADRRESPPH